MASERRELFVGVDVGRKRDLTVMWVLAIDPTRVDAPGLRTVGVIELATTPFVAQFAVLSELMRLRTVLRCCIDAGGAGMALAEEAVRAFGAHRVEALTFTTALKSQLALGLRRVIEERRLVLPADDRVRRDFHSVERGVSASGLFQLSAPRGEQGHADRFWAAALAVHAADGAPGKTEARATAPSMFSRNGAW